MRVEQIRGGVVEAVHDVHVAVVDSAGTLVARAGDPELVTFWRSAAKPFQALPLLEDGAADRFGLTSEELALACASHSSEPEQVGIPLPAFPFTPHFSQGLRCYPVGECFIPDTALNARVQMRGSSIRPREAGRNQRQPIATGATAHQFCFLFYRPTTFRA